MADGTTDPAKVAARLGLGPESRMGPMAHSDQNLRSTPVNTGAAEPPGQQNMAKGLAVWQQARGAAVVLLNALAGRRRHARHSWRLARR